MRLKAGHSLQTCSAAHLFTDDDLPTTSDSPRRFRTCACLHFTKHDTFVHARDLPTALTKWHPELLYPQKEIYFLFTFIKCCVWNVHRTSSTTHVPWHHLCKKKKKVKGHLHFLLGMVWCRLHMAIGEASLSLSMLGRWSWTTLLHYCYRSMFHVTLVQICVCTIGSPYQEQKISNHSAENKKKEKRKEEHILTRA